VAKPDRGISLPQQLAQCKDVAVFDGMVPAIEADPLVIKLMHEEGREEGIDIGGAIPEN
jgi:hypothetical protein